MATAAATPPTAAPATTPTTTPSARRLTLPKDLSGHTGKLLDALTTPELITWTKGDACRVADQPAAIGRVLVQSLHPELVNARIGYLFREKLMDHDHIRLAQASKATGKLAFFSEFDLLIEVNWKAWRWMADAQKIAVLDHELTHFARDIDKKGKTIYRVVAHDIEEFASIVRRWGTWKRDLKTFHAALNEGAQFDLFAKVPQADAVMDISVREVTPAKVRTRGKRSNGNRAH